MGETFADVLAEARRRRGWSQSRLAHEAGFDHSFVSRIERAVKRPTRESAERLSEALAAGPEETARLLLAAGYEPGIIPPHRATIEALARIATASEADQWVFWSMVRCYAAALEQVGRVGRPGGEAR